MPGFDFSNYSRNASLHAKGMPLPKATSTGTTIVGCIYNGGVVIAAGTGVVYNTPRSWLMIRNRYPSNQRSYRRRQEL
jgi:20S proteasome alpha/beta subunit